MTGRVLVVDDVDVNVRLLEAKLVIEYYEVVTANSAAAALELLNKGEVDLILLDVMMPGMDGFALCKQLRADPRTSLTPIILVSALDGDEDRLRGLAAGADDFCTKPIDDAILFGSIRRHLRAKALVDPILARRNGQKFLPVTGQARIVTPELDSEAGRALLRAVPSHNVEGASLPADFLRQVSNSDLAVLDLSSEHLDQLRLLAQIKSNPRTKLTPVIGFADPFERPRWIKAMELGIDAIIAKPVGSRELATRAERLIWKKRQVDAALAIDAASSPATSVMQPGGLDQQPAPHAFDWVGDQIVVSHTAALPSNPAMAAAVFAGVQLKIEQALAGLKGNHADPRLMQSMERFLSCISVAPSAISRGELIMAYRSLQADAATFLNPESEREMTIAAFVADVSLSAADIIVLYPDLRAIEDARLALEVTQPESVQSEIDAIVAAAAASPVVGDGAIEALQELVSFASIKVDDALALDARVMRVHRDKVEVGVGLQLLSIRNFCAAALKVAARETKAVGRDTLKEVRTAIPRGVGDGVQKVISGSIVLGLAALVGAIAGPLMGIAALAASFRPIAARAVQIKDALEKKE